MRYSDSKSDGKDRSSLGKMSNGRKYFLDDPRTHWKITTQKNAASEWQKISEAVNRVNIYVLTVGYRNDWCEKYRLLPSKKAHIKVGMQSYL